MSRARDLANLSNIINKGANLQPNLITNGDMSVDQRNSGSSVTVSNGVDTFCPDRFRFTENHSGTFTIQQVEDAPDDLEYSSKITVTGTDSSLAASEFARILQGIEGQHISHLNWGSANARTCTLTFYVKSSVTGKYYISINNNATNRNMLKAYTINTANTWEKKTIEIIGDTTGTWLTSNLVGIYVMWTLGTGSTYQSSTVDAYQSGFYMGASDQTNLAATASATWQLAGVSFVVGDSAPVTHPYESYSENLQRCQRYYLNLAQDADDVIANGNKYGSSSIFVINLPVEMRTTPTVDQGGSSGDLQIFFDGASNAFSSISLDGDSSAKSVRLDSSTVVSSADGGSGGFLRLQNADGYLALSAEL